MSRTALTPRQEYARRQAELMKETRDRERAEKAAEAAAWQAFKAAGGTLLTPDQLAGFLIPLMNADKHRDAWERDGKAHLARLAAEAAKPKVLVSISFPNNERGPGPMPKALQWLKARECWEGRMTADEARALARALGATLKIDGASSLPMAAE